MLPFLLPSNQKTHVLRALRLYQTHPICATSRSWLELLMREREQKVLSAIVPKSEVAELVVKAGERGAVLAVVLGEGQPLAFDGEEYGSDTRYDRRINHRPVYVADGCVAIEIRGTISGNPHPFWPHHLRKN